MQSNKTNYSIFAIALFIAFAICALAFIAGKPSQATPSQPAITADQQIPAGAIEVPADQVEKLRTAAAQVNEIELRKQTINIQFDAVRLETFANAGRKPAENDFFEQGKRLFIVPKTPVKK
jgi:hypothetical protein